jgi:transposase
MSIDEIAQTLGMGKSLVKEYLNLIDDKEVK